MKVKVGELWTYPETKDAPPLLVTIGQIDTAESLGADANNPAVLSVSLVPIEEARALGWPEVAHCPISHAAFKGGEKVMDDMSTPPDFDQGYVTWNKAFLAGEAGVFNLSPSEAYATIVSLFAADK